MAGAVWLGPLLILAVAAWSVRHGPRCAIGRGLAFGLAIAVLALPSLLTAETFLRPARGTLTSSTDLGNLIQPLSWLQFFGIWPVGDFRLAPGRASTRRTS